MPLDAELDLFIRSLLSAYGGQAGTPLADAADPLDGESMSGSPRLLTYEEVAGRLAVSERHVKRLVADPNVPLVAVHIGAAARIHTDDLRDFMESLRVPEGKSA